MYMSDPILSPDGKWIWTGAEWITAPPASTQPNDVSIQETVSMSKKEKPIKSSINTHKRKFAYVSIVFVILIAVYLLMNSSPEYESQDYWNSQGIGYRFTGDDVYVLVDPIEEQECESLLDDSNWTLIEENGNFCVFDSILFNTISEKVDHHSICIVDQPSCDSLRLYFRGDGLFISPSHENYCLSFVNWQSSVNFSNANWSEAFYEKWIEINPQRPAHCGPLQDEMNNGSDIHLQGFDSQEQMSAKVVLLSTVISDMEAGTESLFSAFELAAGSESVLSNDISFNITCDNNNFSEGTFLGATIHSENGTGNTAITLNPGTTYVVSISVVGCAPAANADNAMVISVIGGGDTYESLQYGSSPAVGDVVV